MYIYIYIWDEILYFRIPVKNQPGFDSMVHVISGCPRGDDFPERAEGVSLRDQLEAVVLAKSSRGLRMLGQNGAFSGEWLTGF